MEMVNWVRVSVVVVMSALQDDGGAESAGGALGDESRPGIAPDQFVGVAETFGLIDQMPMRRADIRAKRAAGRRAPGQILWAPRLGAGHWPPASAGAFWASGLEGVL